MTQCTGIVKWFNNANGRGLLARNDGANVFFHASAIKDNGYKSLNEGAAVCFEMREDATGLSVYAVREDF